jgi:hypothetical protein
MTKAQLARALKKAPKREVANGELAFVTLSVKSCFAVKP